jgi:hypothetical protein
MMAIARSYAAALHLGIDPALPFHHEYKGGSAHAACRHFFSLEYSVAADARRSRFGMTPGLE